MGDVGAPLASATLGSPVRIPHHRKCYLPSYNASAHIHTTHKQFNLTIIMKLCLKLICCLCLIRLNAKTSYVFFF